MTSLPQQQKGEPWCQDGNVVLATSLGEAPTQYFKVHRGLIARHSPLFETMFELPPPTDSDMETVEGCQVVRMYDCSHELSDLLKALYDGLRLKCNTFGDFLHLAGILRLSTKYLIQPLRNDCIRQLSNVWSHTLQGHDTMVSLALRSPLVNDTSYPYVHPLHVINLCRETQTQSILPAAFYFLSLYPATPDLLHSIGAPHPKLLALPDHPITRPSNTLSPIDLALYTMMLSHRVETILTFVKVFCGSREPNPATCAWASTIGADRTKCQRSFSRLSSRLSRSWNIRTGQIHFILQAINDVKLDTAGFCAPCRDAFEVDASRLRHELWDGLPAILGLPDWQKLILGDYSDDMVR